MENKLEKFGQDVAAEVEKRWPEAERKDGKGVIFFLTMVDTTCSPPEECGLTNVAPQDGLLMLHRAMGKILLGKMKEVSSVEEIQKTE